MDLTDEERQRARELYESWLPWLWREAQQQAAPNRFWVMTAGELLALKMPPRIGRGGEARFRRGYVHGYGQAMDDALQSGASPGPWWDRLARFYDRTLMSWRYTRPLSDSTPPPGYRDLPVEQERRGVKPGELEL